MGSLRKALAILFPTRADKRAGAGVVAAMSIAALLEVAGIGMVIPFMTILARPSMIDQTPILRSLKALVGARTDQEAVVFAAALFAGVFVTKSAYVGLATLIQNRFVFGRQARLEAELVSRYLRQPYAFYLKRDTSSLLRVVSYEVGQFFQHVGLSLLLIVVELQSAFLVVLFVCYLEPVALPIVGLGIAAVSVLLYRALHKRAAIVGERHRALHQEMSKWLHEGLGGFKEVRLSGTAEYFAQRYRERSAPSGKLLAEHHTTIALPRLLLEAIGVVGLLVVGVILSRREDDAGVSVIPVLGAIALAAVRLLPSAARVLSAMSLVRYCKPTIDSLYSAISELEASAEEPASTTTDPKAPFAVAELRLDDIAFEYEGANEEALRGVSLTIKHGEHVGIVGPSGGGKTTLVDVMVGLLPPTRGTVFVNGQPLANVGVGRFRERVGYISQHVYLIDDTILRNVAFGAETIDEPHALACLRAARLEAFVESLPEKAETKVGERGVRLSGGQRQRIAIARALYRNPELLVMDEATSSLDGLTEKEIVESLETVGQNRTVIVIAHRLSTVRRCDRILVLENGKVADQGTWSDLLDRSDTFRRLVEASGEKA